MVVDSDGLGLYIQKFAVDELDEIRAVGRDEFLDSQQLIGQGRALGSRQQKTFEKVEKVFQETSQKGLHKGVQDWYKREVEKR
jgi:hypothetical protein